MSGPKFGIAGLHAHERNPPINEHAGVSVFCVNMPEVPKAWEEHIDTLE